MVETMKILDIEEVAEGITVTYEYKNKKASVMFTKDFSKAKVEQYLQKIMLVLDEKVTIDPEVFDLKGQTLDKTA